MRTLVFSLVCLVSACSCGEDPPTIPPREPTPPMAPIAPLSPETEAVPAAPPVRAERPATAVERAARAMALPPADLDRLRTRAAHLREGRRLAHDGDNAGALAEFQAGLLIEPTDATLLCEAGLQAHRTEDLELAQELLERGAAHATRPATRGACLYNLGRVLEDRGDLPSAAGAYTASLEARPNDTVRARLNTLDAVIVAWWEEEEEYAADFDVLAVGTTFATVAELCARVGHVDCWSSGSWAPPTPTATLRELAVFWVHSVQDMMDFGYLMVRSDAGWTLGDRILQCDSSDSYGRLEASEDIARVQFEGPVVVIDIDGGHDEADGEADLYWRCEREHPDDHDGTMACVAAEADALPPPETWSHTRRFRIDANDITEE